MEPPDEMYFKMTTSSSSGFNAEKLIPHSELTSKQPETQPESADNSSDTRESGGDVNSTSGEAKDGEQSDGASNSQNHPTTDLSSPDSESQLESLRKEAEEASVEKVPESTTATQQSKQEYTRSSEVRDYVMARADGECEGCGEPAPFTSKTGEPYLHAHHLNELSDGGSDTPDTVIALCPNCHYRVHHGEDGEEYNQKLSQMIDNLEYRD